MNWWLFHTVHGVLKARILKWFDILFSSGLCFVRTLHYDPSVLGGLHSVAYSFIELDKGVVHVISLVQFSHSVVSDALRPHGLQHARPPCPSPTLGACSNSCPLSRWCHPSISSSVITFSSCLQSFPGSRCFPMSQFFAPGGQSTGASASASVLPRNIQCWFPLGLTGLISLQSKGLSRVFSNTMKEEWDPNKAKLFWGDLRQLPVFIAALCTKAKTWGNPRFHWWMND